MQHRMIHPDFSTGLTGWKNTHAGFEIGTLPFVAIEHDPLKGPFRLYSVSDFIFFVEMEYTLGVWMPISVV